MVYGRKAVGKRVEPGTTRFLARRNTPAGAAPELSALSVDALESASYGCGMKVQEYLTFSRVGRSGSCAATLIGGKKDGAMAAVALGTTRVPFGAAFGGLARRNTPLELPWDALDQPTPKSEYRRRP
jgi:hypothetical protein